MDSNLIEYILPNGILTHFAIINVEEKQEKSGKDLELHIELEEKNILHSVNNSDDYESKGFYQKKVIQDFPIRGKAVYLTIKRRRWRDKLDKNKVINNDYSHFAKGVKLTQELSNFLKATGRDPRRYA